MANYSDYPPPVPQPVPVAPTSTMAIVSLVAGILGWSLVPTLGAIVAVITGHIAKNEIRNSRGALSGDGMATVGLVLGYAHLAVVVIAICLFVVLPIFGLGGMAICAPFLNSINH